MTLDVDSVATDEDLEQYTLGADRLQSLLATTDWWVDLADEAKGKTAKPARQKALDLVLKALDRRRPRISPEQLLDVTQLKDAVCYGALEILYRGAVDHEGSPNVARASAFAKKFGDETSSLQPDLASNFSSPSGLSVRIHRG